MQLGLLSKLMGRPAELKALPVTLQHAPGALRWEAIKGFAGGAIGLAIVVGLSPSPWVGVPLAVISALFALYGVQQFRRMGVRYELTEQSVSRVQGEKRDVIPWSELENFRLHFYGFGRKAESGTLEVQLKAGARHFKVDSAVDHFPTLLAQAARISRDKELYLDPTTLSNLEQLGL